MYVTNEESTKKWFKKQESCVDDSPEAVISSGLKKILDEYANKTILPKCDNRLTGSQIIDKNLQDIIGYLIRDYIYVWYDKLSDNEEFYYHVRNTGQKVIILVATRFVYFEQKLFGF